MTSAPEPGASRVFSARLDAFLTSLDEGSTPNHGSFCSFCYNPLPPGFEVCDHCGLSLIRTCPDCQAVNWSGAEQCVNCGRALDTLDHLMNRLQEGTEGRLSRQQAESRSFKEEEEAAAQRRSAYFMEIEQRRQQELAEAKRKADRERQIMQLFAIGAVVVVALIMVVFVALNFTR